MNISLNDKQLETIFTKMFSFVKETYTKEFTKTENWYRTREWPKDVELLFRNWLIKYFMQNLDLNKKRATSTADWFLLSYGWKVKE
jgi:predicted transcriptional regulator